MLTKFSFGDMFLGSIIALDVAHLSPGIHYLSGEILARLGL